ncbi:MAG: hypothetical protein QXU40_03415 [Candidatus Pacearchaeota archaeon]
MNIDSLSIQELMELNRKIVRRIRELRRIKLHTDLRNFTEGDKVSFNNNGNTITGIVIRINQKSLTIKTDQGTWYVDPSLATKLHLPKEESDGNIYRKIESSWLNN